MVMNILILFIEGKEIAGYASADELIDKIHYYLEHDSERIEIAKNAYHRVMKDYRISKLLHSVGDIIREASK